MMKISVIGAGRIGWATAGHMALSGHEVRLYEFPEFRDSIADLSKTQVLKVINVCRETGIPSGDVRLAYVGTDEKKALENVETVLIAVPAFAERKAAEICAPYLVSGQTVVMLAGCIYGSVEFLKTVREKGNACDIAVVEMNNSPYAARKIGGDAVRIGCYKRGVGIASFPGNKGREAWKICVSLFPYAELWDSLLATGVSNPSTGVHSTAVVFNPRYVEEKEEVFMYQDGKHLSAIGESVGRVNFDMDMERLQLDGIVGSLKPWRYVFRDWYEYLGVHGNTLLEIMSSNPGLAGGLLPTDFDNRFLTEDVSMGIWPLVELLERYGFCCDVCKSVAIIASSLSGIDLKGTARTLRKLGLEKYSTEELEEYIFNGI